MAEFRRGGLCERVCAGDARADDPGVPDEVVPF